MPAPPEPDETDGSGWPTLSVVIASYQRREPVLRLLEGLADELRSDADLAVGVDVVVVVDGSSDGSKEALAELEMPVPMTVLWHENSGLATTRNVGWQHSGAQFVWFLDDDLVPGAGLLRLHRDGSRAGGDSVLVGPCVIPTTAGTTQGTREWWDDRYASMASGGITRFDQFSAANTSLPRVLLERVGGFDGRFVGYGWEDYEIGLRLLDAGVEIRFDPHAVAWHEQHRREAELCRLRREEGRNVVRFVHLHPHRLHEVIGVPSTPLPLALLARGLVLLRPLVAVAVAVALPLVAAVGERPAARLVVRVVSQLCFAVGVLEEDGDGRVTGALLTRAAAKASRTSDG